MYDGRTDSSPENLPDNGSDAERITNLIREAAQKDRKKGGDKQLVEKLREMCLEGDEIKATLNAALERVGQTKRSSLGSRLIKAGQVLAPKCEGFDSVRFEKVVFAAVLAEQGLDTEYPLAMDGSGDGLPEKLVRDVLS